MAQARRLLAIAAILDGAPRAEAARIGGMDREMLRDWVIRFNEYGPEGLINWSRLAHPRSSTQQHGAFLARVVEEGRSRRCSVVRWRGCDLMVLLHEEFGIEVSSDDTVYRALKQLGFAHLSARPRAYKQDAEAMEAFKKIP